MLTREGNELITWVRPGKVGLPGAEKILGDDENWRVPGTRDDPVVRAAEGAIPERRTTAAAVLPT